MFQKSSNRIYMNDENGRMVAEITFPETSPGTHLYCWRCGLCKSTGKGIGYGKSASRKNSS